MIKAILFDAYGTIIDTSNGSLKACAEILSKNRCNLDPAVFYKRWKVLHKDYIRSLSGFVTEEEVFYYGLKKLYGEFSIDGNAEQDVAIMLDTLGKRKAFPETNAVLAALRQRYKIYIGSTSDHKPLMTDIRNNHIVVDQVFSSESMKVYKPQPAFYRKLLEQIGCQASETIFAGDSLDDDVWGPTQCGIKTVWVNRKGESRDDNSPCPTHEIAELTGMISIMQNG